MTFDGGDVAIWSRCLHLPFRGNWGLQLIAAVKFNARDKLLILPGVSVRLGCAGQEAVTCRVQRWLLGIPSRWVSAVAALKIAEGISAKTFLGPELLGIFIRSKSNLIEYRSSASFIKMETDNISEINSNAKLLGTRQMCSLGASETAALGAERSRPEGGGSLKCTLLDPTSEFLAQEGWMGPGSLHSQQVPSDTASCCSVGQTLSSPRPGADTCPSEAMARGEFAFLSPAWALHWLLGGSSRF